MLAAALQLQLVDYHGVSGGAGNERPARWSCSRLSCKQHCQYLHQTAACNHLWLARMPNVWKQA
jgi:hypothetical protein